jgi:hypothetical protein
MKTVLSVKGSKRQVLSVRMAEKVIKVLEEKVVRMYDALEKLCTVYRDVNGDTIYLGKVRIEAGSIDLAQEVAEIARAALGRTCEL